MEDNFWTCECGNSNTGRFCSSCGRERPYRQSNSWTCECGNKNTGRFCSVCGREKPSGDNMLSAVFAEDKRVKGKMNTVNEIRKWSGSWVVLVLSVLVSVTFLCSLISFIMQIAAFGFNLGLIGNIIGLLLGLIVCIGFWRAFASGRKQSDNYSSGGARMLRGMLVFYQVLAYIIMIIALVLTVALVIITAVSMDWLSEVFGEIFAAIAEFTGIDIFGMFGTAGILVLVFVLVGVILAFVLVGLFFRFTKKFARAAIQRLDGVSNQYQSATAAAVFFFLLGISYLAIVILPLVSPGLIAFITFTGGWISIISGIAGALTFIFAGVLAVSFNGAQKRAQY